ncbi:MAG: 50S ribosomal protein L32 [Patescibacteria group bacterium]
MSVPSKRRPRSEAGGRAFHLRLKKRMLIACSHCKKEIPTHRVCPFCGYYKGREVIHIKLKKEKGKKHKEKADQNEKVPAKENKPEKKSKEKK